MTAKEAEDIAYEIYCFHDTCNNTTGLDCAMVIANEAQEIFDKILNDHPKIKDKYDWWSA